MKQNKTYFDNDFSNSLHTLGLNRNCSTNQTYQRKEFNEKKPSRDEVIDLFERLLLTYDQQNDYSRLYSRLKKLEIENNKPKRAKNPVNVRIGQNVQFLLEHFNISALTLGNRVNKKLEEKGIEPIKNVSQNFNHYIKGENGMGRGIKSTVIEVFNDMNKKYKLLGSRYNKLLRDLGSDDLNLSKEDFEDLLTNPPQVRDK